MSTWEKIVVRWCASNYLGEPRTARRRVRAGGGALGERERDVKVNESESGKRCQ